MSSKKKARIILYSIEEALFGTILILALLTISGIANVWDMAEAKLMVVATLTAMCLLPLVPLVEKILKVDFSIIVDIFICVDVCLSVLLGEAFNFYYDVPNWDKILHFFGTAQIAFLGFLLATFFLRKTNTGTHQLLFAAIFGFFFAIAIESLWEVYEFTMDTLTGSNMQKYMPESFLQYIDENGNWIGDEATLIEFYSSQAGRQYAVHDTMWDIIVDSLGSAAGISVALLITYQKPEWATRFLMSHQEAIALEAAENEDTLSADEH